MSEEPSPAKPLTAAARRGARNWLLWWRLAVGVGLLTALLLAVGLEKLADTFRRLAPGWALAVTALLAVWLVLGGLKVWLLLRRLAPVPLRVFLPAYLTSWATSLLLPGQLGDVTQVVLLRRQGISMASSGAAYLLDKSMSLGWMLLVSIYGINLYTPLSGFWLLALAALAVLGAGAGGLILSRLPLRSGIAIRLRGALERLLGQLLTFRGHPGTVVLILVLTIVKWLLLAVIYAGAFHAFGHRLAFEAAATIPVMSSFIGYVPVTVGGAGTSEWTAVLLFERAGVGGATVLSAYLFLRVVLLAGAFCTISFPRLGGAVPSSRT